MFTKAIDAYEKFISIEGVPMLQHERYAYLLFFTDQFQKSLQEIDYLIKHNPSNQVAFRIQAYNHFELGNTALAAQKMAEFLKTAETPILQDYIIYGRALIKEKQPKAAIEALQKALEMDPSQVDLHKEIIGAYDDLKDVNGKLKAYEKYLEVAENASAADYFNYGATHYTEASKYIDEAYFTGLTPEQVQAANAQFQNHVDKGTAAFTKLIELNPTTHLGYLLRANIIFLVDYKERPAKNAPLRGLASSYYEEALNFMLENNADGKRNNDIIDIYDYFASYYLLKDDKVNAGENYKKILTIDPTNEKAINTLKQLKIKY
jgi:predicted Zn-dependent protease